MRRSFVIDPGGLFTKGVAVYLDTLGGAPAKNPLSFCRFPGDLSIGHLGSMTHPFLTQERSVKPIFWAHQKEQEPEKSLRNGNDC